LDMSAAEIIAELPKLSGSDLAAVRRRLRELDERDELQFLHDSADAMFQELDKQEAEYARRKARSPLQGVVGAPFNPSAHSMPPSTCAW
jgi:hypothetical protein